MKEDMKIVLPMIKEGTFGDLLYYIISETIPYRPWYKMRWIGNLKNMKLK